MKKLTWTLAILGAVGLVACGDNKNDGGNGNPVADVREAAEAPVLQGATFESEQCLDPLVLKLFSAKGMRIRYTFAGNNVSRITMFFPNSDCTGDVAATLTEYGTFDQRADLGGGVSELDLDFSRLEATVNSAEGERFAEEVNACGRSAWNVAETVDVSGQADQVNCYNSKVPRHVEEIYRVENDRLYFGSGYSPKADERRPTQVNTAEVFVKR